MGPPGAGKGTQAARIAEELKIVHISTGDLFRANIANQTPLGVEAKRYLDAGDLVPSELTNKMVDARTGEDDARNGFVLDGYPRTVDQAEALEALLESHGRKLDAVVSLDVDEEVVVSRMLARGRADDTEAVIRNRLKVYREETAPLLDHYDGLVVTVDGEGEVTDVTKRILDVLNS